MISEPVKTNIDFFNGFGVKSILEIGAGGGGIITQFPVQQKVGVEWFTNSIQNGLKIRDDVILIRYDVTKIDDLFLPNSVDAVIGYDILEHLEEDDMYKVIKKCERIARKAVSFFSPIGEEGLKVQQSPINDNPSMIHATVIDPEHFKKNGYKVMTYPNYYLNNTVDAMLAMKVVM